ncbi:MAG TPA: hypothetical protein VM487_00160 [Phycisphaerae bacterium]|nr:hypothetical protein [Phycisphaerae bacterium]
MTGREKILAGVVGGVVALAGGSTLLRLVVIEPLKSLNKSLGTAAQKKANLEDFVEQHQHVAEEWQAYTARTFSENVERVKVSFFSELAQLLELHDLTEGHRITQGTPRKQKTGLVEVSLRVHAEGSLESVVGFMRDLRQKPYLARLSNVSLRAEKGRSARRTRGRGRGSNEPATLAVSMTATTLVLPKLKGTKHQPPDPNQPAPTYLAYGPEAYDEIASVNFFQKYRPPVRTVQTPTTRESVDRGEREPPPPPRPNMKVVGVESLYGDLIASVLDEDHREKPLAEFRLNDKIDDGTLILVHPKGIVVRVAKREGADEESEEYFYPIGSSFRDRLRLEEADPEIRHELYSEGPKQAARPSLSPPAERLDR